MFNPKDSYNYQELLDCGHGRLFEDGGPTLPLPPMLMFDRISLVTDKGGKYDLGHLTAELDINPNLWFFQCHFENDPVMPGCLGLDALWQLGGFFLGWLGEKGHGRALGAGEVKFTGQVLPTSKKVVYEIDVKRLIRRRLIMIICDGTLYVDGKLIYEAEDLKIGLFKDANF